MQGGHPEVAMAFWRCAYAWQPTAMLPDAAWRERVAGDAEAASGRAMAEGQLGAATRYEALATFLSGGDPHRRHRTEDLRALMFPVPRR